MCNRVKKSALKSRLQTSFVLVCIVLVLVLPFPALAEMIPGPVLADVIRVVDGDTVDVDAHPWPGMTIRIRVRLAGIDTPEMKARCPEEKDMALRAKQRLGALAGSVVRLTDIRRGKYAGRMVAVVWRDGKRLADVLIAEGLGREYHGGRRGSWC